MTTDPEQIRGQIEVTRTQLSDDVSQLADAASPSQIAARQMDRMKDKVGDIKDKVMGRDDDEHRPAGSGGAQSTGGSSRIAAAPRWVRQQTSANPWPAGLVALGIGWAIGSMLPASQAEQAVAGGLSRTAGPVLADTASEIGDHLREPATEAAESVRSAASDAVGSIGDEARQATQRTGS